VGGGGWKGWVRGTLGGVGPWVLAHRLFVLGWRGVGRAGGWLGGWGRCLALFWGRCVGWLEAWGVGVGAWGCETPGGGCVGVVGWLGVVGWFGLWVAWGPSTPPPVVCCGVLLFVGAGALRALRLAVRAGGCFVVCGRFVSFVFVFVVLLCCVYVFFFFVVFCCWVCAGFANFDTGFGRGPVFAVVWWCEGMSRLDSRSPRCWRCPTTPVFFCFLFLFSVYTANAFAISWGPARALLPALGARAAPLPLLFQQGPGPWPLAIQSWGFSIGPPSCWVAVCSVSCPFLQAGRPRAFSHPHQQRQEVSSPRITLRAGPPAPP
jgi:hypothetical protein